ncbi:MAG: MCD, Malonyl-CoA decarboxylase MCD [Rhizobiales bacterium 62-17]|nr:malonyl-CoA decarboxylase [Hyphomicrobiales bacterium]OJY01294.1 MAG: MCD, Malonyl-CoA decarboxylase MCD [Rhizobiales bacterium 62-17]
MSNAFFSDLMTTIADRGRTLLRLESAPIDPQAQALDLVGLCEQLLSGRGEASGTALAREVLDRYARLDDAGRETFFLHLARDFGPDPARLTPVVEKWEKEHSDAAATDLHYASEPRRQELLRRLNRAPGGTAALVVMREHLLALRRNPEMKVIDKDLVHLLGSWFNRGFLVLRRIDWSSTPANVLDKIIRYEAVHAIHDWNDLRRRIDPIDRRCYAFFHPAMIDEPLIFVEVALTADIPGAVQPLLAEQRDIVPLKKARTAVFYSISNCQQGLAGISFGNFLIKQVVEELRRELAKIENFVTLSPVPGFMNWLMSKGKEQLSEDDRLIVDTLHDLDWPQHGPFNARAKVVLEQLAAQYFLEEKAANNRPLDPVARFHLGNGARLERINWLGDRSTKGMLESAGLMVNYLYDLDDIEKNHEAYANQGEIAASSAVRKLLKSSSSRRWLANVTSAKG